MSSFSSPEFHAPNKNKHCLLDDPSEQKENLTTNRAREGKPRVLQQGSREAKKKVGLNASIELDHEYLPVTCRLPRVEQPCPRTSNSNVEGIPVSSESTKEGYQSFNFPNFAICLTAWDEQKVDMETISCLDGEQICIELEGEYLLKRLYGGSKFPVSNSEAKKANIINGESIRKRKRSPTPSDEETDTEYDKPQTEDNQWVVEKVLCRRQIVENGERVVQLYLKWKGWTYEYSTWEPDCTENSIAGLVRSYNRRIKWKDVVAKRVAISEKIFFQNYYMSGAYFKCQEWEDSMNKVLKTWKVKLAPIYVENWVDSEGRPKDFEFILHNKFSNETEKKFEGIAQIEHCLCVTEGEQCGGIKNCCPENLNQNYCYLEDGHLNPRQVSNNNNWIVECTDACACDIKCPTRVVQRGRQLKLVIFRTLDRGWAIRTCTQIKRHSFVCEYVGKVITVDEASTTKNTLYQFDMDGGGQKEFAFVIDAANCGNEARFVNHSCNPNMIVKAVFADRLDKRYHRIAFFAKRDIKQGDELTIDYCALDQFAKGRRKKPCQCKSKQCKGFFYY